MEIKIKSSTESAFSIQVTPTQTVLQLKQELSKQVSAPVESLRLIFSGRVLKDPDTLQDCKIAEGNTIHLVKGTAAPPSTPQPAVVTPQPAATSPTSLPDSRSSPAANPLLASLLGNQAQPGNPFASLPGLNAAGGIPPMDPALLNNLLQNPQAMAGLSAMFSNPQMLDAIINSNPQLASMPPQQREFMRSIMSNPQMMQMMLTSLQNPAMMNPAMMNAAMMNPNAASTPSGMAPLPMPFLNPAMMNPALMGMMNNSPMGSAAANTNLPPPEERFQVQLTQLQEMGFFDAGENIRALTMTNGNVEAAVEYLFSHPPGQM